MLILKDQKQRISHHFVKRIVQVRKLSIFSLVMMNIAALGGIKTWAPIAESGFTAVFFLILATLVFFLPTALISSELSTSWPKSGGVYVWIKEAFGHKLAFLSIWLLWIENVIWYPTILSFIAAAITFIFNPELIHNKLYMVSLILTLFWGATIANFFGLKISSWISSVGAICGTFIPSFLIIGLGLVWYLQGNQAHISFSMDNFFPDFTSGSQLMLFSGVIASFLGIEMSSIHAGNVHNPTKTYSRAILLSAFCVIVFSTLGVLTIEMVVPASELSLNAGCLQAFSFLLNAFALKGLLPWIAIIVAIGAAGSMSTWIVGPCSGLIFASQEHDLPPLLTKLNKKKVPQNLLICQAILVSCLSLVFLFMPTVNNAYWMLLILTTQLYLIMYVLLFAAAIKLKYKFPDLHRPFQVPGGKIGMWITAGLGILSSLFTFGIAFVPPANLSPEASFHFIAFLVVSITFLSSIPYLSRKFLRKPALETPLTNS